MRLIILVTQYEHFLYSKPNTCNRATVRLIKSCSANNPQLISINRLAANIELHLRHRCATSPASGGHLPYSRTMRRRYFNMLTMLQCALLLKLFIYLNKNHLSI